MKQALKHVDSGNELGTALLGGNLGVSTKSRYSLFDAAIPVLWIYPDDTPQIIKKYIYVQGYSFWHCL